jgi:transposase
MNSSYPSDLSVEEFDLIQPFLADAKPGGRPRSVDLWQVLNGIFYLLAEGCRWRALWLKISHQ